MYDRKTWIIVTLCSILLAVNFYLTKQNEAELARRAPSAPPAAASPESTEAVAGAEAGLSATPPTPTVEEQPVLLETDAVTFVLTNLGGGIKEARLKHEHEVGNPDRPVVINRGGIPIGTLLHGSELLESGGFLYNAAKSEPGKRAVFLGKTATGLVVEKAFSVVEGDEVGREYLLDLTVTLKNTGTNAAPLDAWTLALGTAAPLYERETPQWTSFFWRGESGYDFEDANYFDGGFFSSDKSAFERRIEKVEFAGVANQFFATVLRANEPYESSLWAKPRQMSLPGNPEGPTMPAVRAGVTLPSTMLAAGDQRALSYRIFMGPKDNRMLRRMEGNLGDIMNYGMFSWVSRFLNWLMNVVHELWDGVSTKWSWGFAVVTLTIIIRTLIWPLHAKSTRTMKRMSKLQPELKALKEKYPDDPTRMNQEMMKLYKKFGVNPLGGCLPMFLQIPIFFGFYRMLQYAAELRHKEFLWVQDLSQPDTMAVVAGIPINVLPILMGLTMVVQMKLTPQTADKMQQRIMMLMPVVFFVFCYNFASALALYWTTQNIFSIGQTWLMNRLPEPELKARKGGKGGKTWMEKLAERQEEMKRLQAARQSGSSTAADSAKAKKKRPPRTGG